MREIKWILGQCEDSLQVLCTVIGAVGFYAFFTIVAFENIGWEAGVLTLIGMLFGTALLCRLPGMMEKDDNHCDATQSTEEKHATKTRGTNGKKNEEEK